MITNTLSLLPKMHRAGILFLGLMISSQLPLHAETKSPAPHASGIVSQHGKLKVIGTALCDKYGAPIQIKGMSAHQLQHYPWTSSTVGNLVKQYHNTMVRAAMYIEEEGYLTDPVGMTAKTKIIIDAAIANDIYVLIDWHGVGGDPNKYTAQAKVFFQEISAAYRSSPNIIYEIYNEPTVDWAAIKHYANQIIPVIRANDPDSVIIVGTPTYCAAPQEASKDLLKFPNLMYTLHFYCGDATKEADGQGQRDNVAGLIANGMPIFVTEWGTSNYTGDGGPYPVTAQKWIDFMAAHKLSWANWSLATKQEGSAFLKPTANMNGPWTDDDLSPAGLFMKDKF